MKKLIYLIILVLLSINVQSQTPQFETTFYFEDAVGNKDSVIVGYDPNVQDYSNGFISYFGEKPISAPFDTILDVRIDPTRKSGSPYLFYKRIIGFCEQSPIGICYGGTAGAFIISNKFKPLKISYSQKAFGDANISGSFMTHNGFYDAVGPQALDYSNYFCLSDINEHTIDFGDSSYVNGFWGLFKKNVPMIGGALDKLPQLNFYMGPGECLFHTATIEHNVPMLRFNPDYALEIKA